jgi:predicted metal-binding membrane protein
MGGLAPQAGLDRSLEAVLRRDRRIVAASLALVVALAWVYLWRDAASMGAPEMASMSMSGMPGAHGTWSVDFRDVDGDDGRHDAA